MQKIPGHPMYSVTKDGKVFSHYIDKYMKLTERYGDTNYLKVGLLISSRPKKYKHYYVHQLVLLTYQGTCPEGKQCAHLDGNPHNNNLHNLVYVTPKENTAHQKHHGTRYTSFALKITEEILGSIFKDYDTGDYTKAELAIKYNVSERTILRHFNRR